jgi:hypothetical protein
MYSNIDVIIILSVNLNDEKSLVFTNSVVPWPESRTL